MEKEKDFCKMRALLDKRNEMVVYLAAPKLEYMVLEWLSPNDMVYYLSREGGWIPFGEDMFPVFGGNELAGFKIQKIMRLSDGAVFAVGDITKFGAIERMVKSQDHYRVIVHTMTNKIVDYRDL